jgi:hypothetical protein
MEVLPWLDDDPTPEGLHDGYAHIILAVADHAPLMTAPRYARQALAGLSACASDAPGRLWGGVIVPDSLRLIVGPGSDAAVDAFVARLRAETSARLLEAIRRADDDALDVVLRYSPVWGGALYRVWQAGYHQGRLWSEYQLSNALYEMMQLPVALGLFPRADDWPYRYLAGE